MRPLSVFPQAVLSPFFLPSFKKKKKKAILISLHFKHTWPCLICYFIKMQLKLEGVKARCTWSVWLMNCSVHVNSKLIRQWVMKQNMTWQEIWQDKWWLKIFQHLNHLQVTFLTLIHEFNIWPENMNYSYFLFFFFNGTQQNYWQTVSLETKLTAN